MGSHYYSCLNTIFRNIGAIRVTYEEKMKLIAKAIEIDPSRLARDTLLDSLEEWDSLAIMGVVAMLDKHFDVQLKADDIAGLKTINHILKHTGEDSRL